MPGDQPALGWRATLASPDSTRPDRPPAPGSCGAATATSIVIPAYNEATTIGRIVEELLTLPGSHEVVVVDDGSTDGTADVARASGATVLRHPYNIGYGAAIRKGVRYARHPVVVLMDADAQHEPRDVARLVEQLGDYDMVVGARGWRAKGSLGRAVAISVLSWFASYMAGRKIPDLTSGFRAIRREALYPFLHLLPNGFSASTTMTLALIRGGRAVAFVPWETIRARADGASKVTPLRDGLRIMLTIVRIVALFSPLRVFLPASLVLMGYGAVRLVQHLLAGSRPFDLPFALLGGVLLFFLGLFADHFAFASRAPRDGD